ncbi:hypothetical protein WN944_018662 [Citrus x changshan-huyou]|uniref:Phytocyanin domain-containing protein n=1 Tax=Citrus x changshan-huyou TaxID=2935761 RepID=A0AAP0LX74_9ROSI
MGFRKTKRYIIVAALSFLLVMATAATVCVGGGGGAEKVVSLGGIGFLRNINVGDTIVFEYNRQSDNVIVLRNRKGFESKSLNQPSSTTGADSILLRFPGRHYFWCGFPGHCQAG